MYAKQQRTQEYQQAIREDLDVRKRLEKAQGFVDEDEENDEWTSPFLSSFLSLFFLALVLSFFPFFIIILIRKHNSLGVQAWRKKKRNLFLDCFISLSLGVTQTKKNI